MWEGNAKFVKQLETAVEMMTAAKRILGCSSTTSNTVQYQKRGLGMYPLETISLVT